MIDFITGERFIGVADLVFVPRGVRGDDYIHIQNTFSIDSARKYHPCIVYTHTFYVNELFNIIRGLDWRFIVITHNCDMNIDFIPPDNVVMWYAQNVIIEHPRITAIPIGLQNGHWNKYGNKYSIMENKLKEPRKCHNLVYVNHSIITNPTKRTLALEHFLGKPWATTARYTKNFERFEDYIENIYNHKFVVCPEGNGIDTHRVWETLYMGSIPIVPRHMLTDLLYSYFPCAICDDWSEVTEEWLNKEYKAINSIREWFDGDKKMLTFAYWSDKIRNLI